MPLIEQPGYTFSHYVRALRGQFGNDLPSLIMACNRDMFGFRRSPTPWFMNIAHNRIQVGKFYFINYDFNGNKLYCPIFTIDYRVKESGKHVIYAINLDYLPFEYKLLYFDKLYNLANNIFSFNKDAQDFTQEQPIPVNFEQIYRTLKDNGDFNYAISAFDITKIVELYGVSTNLMYIMIHVHMRPVNIALMKELMQRYEEGAEERMKLGNLIDKLEEMQETYEEDVQTYYKKLRNLENNYKLFD